MAEEKKTYKFVCIVCGYEVEVDTPELPEDYVCPVCGVGPDQFELVEGVARRHTAKAEHSSVQGPRLDIPAGALLIYLTV